MVVVDSPSSELSIFSLQRSRRQDTGHRSFGEWTRSNDSVTYQCGLRVCSGGYYIPAMSMSRTWRWFDGRSTYTVRGVSEEIAAHPHQGSGLSAQPSNYTAFPPPQVRPWKPTPNNRRIGKVLHILLLNSTIEALNLAKETSDITSAKAAFDSVGVFLVLIRVRSPFFWNDLLRVHTYPGFNDERNGFRRSRVALHWCLSSPWPGDRWKKRGRCEPGRV